MSLSHSVNPALIEALVKTVSSLPSDRPVQAFVLAVAVRAASLHIPENDLGLFLKKQTASRPGLSDLLSSSAYRRLVTAARFAALSSTPEGADKNALRISRVTIGRILSPVELPEGETGLSAARMIRARVVLGILATEQIKSVRSELGWNTLMVSHPWLALRMGASWPTAKAALSDLVRLGWIKEVGGSRPDSARRFKFTKRLTKAQGQVIKPDHLFRAIGSLALLEPNQVTETDQLNDDPNRVPDLIQSVAHPAWCYGSDPLGSRAFLVALAIAAGVDPVGLDVGSRYISKAKKALESAGLGDTAFVSEPLNTWAARTGAFEAAAQAKATYKEHAASRTEEIATTRAIRAQAKVDAEAFFGPALRIPAAGTSRDLMNAWLQGATGVMDRKVLADAQVKALSRELAKKFKARGYEGDTVTKLAGIVTGAASSLIGPDETIPSAADEAAAKQEWLEGMVEKMAGRTLADEVRAAATHELIAKMRRRGFAKEKAGQLAGIILGVTGPVPALPSPKGTPQVAPRHRPPGLSCVL